MPAALSSREAVIETLTDLIRRDGYDGVSISQISQATGLGRPSLYNYFPGGKEQMVESVVQSVAAWIDEHVIAKLEADLPPRERAEALIATLHEFYHGGRARCLLNVLAFGESRRRFAPALRASANRWLRALARVAEDAGAGADDAQRRALEALVTIEGALVVASVLGKGEAFSTSVARLPEILAPASRKRRA